MQRHMIEIDGDKLRAALRSAGTSATDAARQIGFSINYINMACRGGAISREAADAIYATFGIRSDEYATLPEEPEGQEQDTEKAPEQARRERTAGVAVLREIIREAILDAAVQLLADEDWTNALQHVIYRGAMGAQLSADRIIKSGGN